MLNAYIYDGIRTPFGRHAGKLASVRPDDMIADLMKKLIERTKIDPEQVEDVIIGCAGQAGEDSRNIARHAVLLSGLPVTTPGITLNRLCSSGLAAVLDAARAITCGEGDLFLAGGVESMTRSPFVFAKSESAYGREIKVEDSSIGARFPNPKITREFGNDPLTQTADNIAHDLNISREDCDRFAYRSQATYQAAKCTGFFDDEIVPVTIVGRKATVVVAEDEHPRADTTVEALAKLRAVHPNGVTTAGNASGVNDGAGVMLVGSRKLEEQGVGKAKVRILSSAAVGVPPRVMGLGPVEAIRKALGRAGLTLKDMDLIEINEAFAAQVLGCLNQLGLAYDDSRINPNGGAIALGHPLGASGARLALTAMRQLERIQGRYAMVSLCIGVGQGLAVVMERCQ